jgi:hypothetical protein
MRQFRIKIPTTFKKPKIKTKTSRAYLFEFENDTTQWIPRAWIKSIGQEDGKYMQVKEYWATEMLLQGFVRVSDKRFFEERNKQKKKRKKKGRKPKKRW